MTDWRCRSDWPLPRVSVIIDLLLLFLDRGNIVIRAFELKCDG